MKNNVHNEEKMEMLYLSLRKNIQTKGKRVYIHPVRNFF